MRRVTLGAVGAIAAGVAVGLVVALLVHVAGMVRTGGTSTSAWQECNYWPWGYHGSLGTSQCYYGGSLGPEADACPSCLKWPAP